MMHQFKSTQFLRFLVTGGFAAGVNFGSRIFYSNWFDFSTAVVVAYITGMLTAFILARHFVFRETERMLHHSIIFFTIVNFIAAAQTWLISMGLYYYVFPTLNIVSFSEDISHGVGIVFPVFTSYLGHKYFTFK